MYSLIIIRIGIIYVVSSDKESSFFGGRDFQVPACTAGIIGFTAQYA